MRIIVTRAGGVTQRWLPAVSLVALLLAAVVALEPAAARLSAGSGQSWEVDLAAASQFPTATEALLGQRLGPRPQARADDLVPGALLVAGPGLLDPNFAQTVVLIVERTDEGAMGLVLNRRSEVTIGRVVESVEALSDLRHLADPVFVGGPVSRSGLLALVRSSRPIPEGTHVSGEVYVVGSADGLRRRLASEPGSDWFRLYLGYAGWGAGQLERELAEGAWHVLPGTASVVFDRNPDTLWIRMIRRADVQMVHAASGFRFGA